MILRPWFAFAAGFVATMTLCYVKLPLFPEKDLASILGTIAQSSASMMGFMIAALAILASIADKPLIKGMQSTGHYRDLLRTIFSASAIFALAFLVSTTVLVGMDTLRFWRELLLGTLVAGAVSIAQTGWKFWLVLANISPSSIHDSGSRSNSQ